MLSILTGAAVAPALHVIGEHFKGYDLLTIQFIASLPALFIILTTFIFPWLCNKLKLRTLTILALLLYICAGAGCFFMDNIYVLLCLRALLGVSVGIIMPLTTGLISHFCSPDDQPRLMGYSATMNEFGALLATLFSGVLSSIGWNYTFLIYIIGVIPMVLVLLFIPNERLQVQHSKITWATFKQFYPCVICMMLTMMLFFVFVTNFARTSMANPLVGPLVLTALMASRDIMALFIDLSYGRIARRFEAILPYIAPVTFLVGFAFLVISNDIVILFIGMIFLAIANGVGIPQLNTVASWHGGRESVVTVMPLMSAAFFLGEFLSPIIVRPISAVIGTPTAPYIVGMGISAIFLAFTFATRKFHNISRQKE